MTIEGIEVHPSAELFPMMEPKDLRELADDIREHGLRQPILKYRGQLLDGRNRLKACVMANVQPRFDEAQINGASPTRFVVSMNLKRRQLTLSQRAAVGAEMMPLLKAEAKERQRESGRYDRAKEHGAEQVPAVLPEPAQAADSQPINQKSEGVESVVDEPPADARGEWRDRAGRAVGVGGRTVGKAAKVQAADPVLFQVLKDGGVNVEQAYDRVTQRENHQAKKAVEREAKSAKAAVEPKKRPKPGPRNFAFAKRRMIDILSQINGMCKGVALMRVDLIAPVLTREESTTWIEMARHQSRTLRDFAQRLEAADGYQAG